MKEQLFSKDEIVEIINIVKGIFRYAKQSRNVLHNESLFLDLLEQTCSKVTRIVQEKNENENNNN